MSNHEIVPELFGTKICMQPLFAAALQLQSLREPILGGLLQQQVALLWFLTFPNQSTEQAAVQSCASMQVSCHDDIQMQHWQKLP